MGLKSAVLVLEVLVLVVASCWADGAPRSVAANDSGTAVSSSDANGYPPQLSLAGNSSALLINNSESNNVWDVCGSTSSLERCTNSFLFSGDDFNRADLRDMTLYEIISSDRHMHHAWPVPYPVLHHDRDNHSHPQPVPEPGSLVLLLFGLALIGLSAIARIVLGRAD
jgi:PEP-CTERM motif